MILVDLSWYIILYIIFKLVDSEYRLYVLLQIASITQFFPIFQMLLMTMPLEQIIGEFRAAEQNMLLCKVLKL